MDYKALKEFKNGMKVLNKERNDSSTNLALLVQTSQNSKVTSNKAPKHRDRQSSIQSGHRKISGEKE